MMTRRGWRVLRNVLMFALLLILLYTYWVVDFFEVPSESMAPALRAGDRVIAIKLRGRSPQPQSVVVLRDPDNQADFVIKRVIALPGDTLLINSGRTLKNGKLLKEDYAHGSSEYVLGPLTVPEGRMIVLGDNRDVSRDSSVWGPVSQKNLIGTVVYIYYPFSRRGRV